MLRRLPENQTVPLNVQEVHKFRVHKPLFIMLVPQITSLRHKC